MLSGVTTFLSGYINCPDDKVSQAERLEAFWIAFQV
jgi:hypothetical protein